MSRNHLLLILLCVSQFVTAQKNIFKVPDSLQHKSYDYLDERAYELKKDSLKAAVYLYAYLHKAKNEHNWKEIVNGYQSLLHLAPDNLRLVYADSMVYAAQKTNDHTVIGSAYLSKGIANYALKQHSQALDNYITANEYISQTNDNYLIYKLKYHIALVKYYLGYYEEAISLLKECISFFKDKNPRPYLHSLHSLGLCYNRIGNYGLCNETNILGLEECKKLDVNEMEVYFIHSQGINEYFNKNYASAIKNIESSIEELKEKKDFANESVGYFYIGKSYWEVKKYEKAIFYFEKVDQLFNNKGYLRLDQREIYELLINYYQTKDNDQLELYYVKQLLKADTVLNETFTYLVGKINKEYNTQDLSIKKKKLEDQLIKKSRNYSVLIGFTSLLFTSFTFLTYRYFKNRRLYKQKFDELMLKITSAEEKTKPNQKTEKSSILDINHETVTAILKQLEKFENGKRFLEKDWTLSKLSTALNSNPSYVSPIINHYKNKGFNEYISDLKIDYIIKLLRTNRIVQNYNNEALAKEVGFSSKERFVKAFKAKTEITPTFFIRQIKKENQ